MKGLKSAFDMIRAFMPVVYCGGLLGYFLYVSNGSLENANALGLGPTFMGLGVIGLIFCIPLALKLIRLFRRPPSSGSGGGPDAPDNDGFDPDAAIARYMAQRLGEALSARPSAAPAPRGNGPGKPSGFGRRGR